MIIKCTCKNEAQDKLYGVEKRVFNRCKPNEATPHYRCTVCKKEVIEPKRGG